MTPQDPGVYITTTQMFQEMRSLHDTVSRVEVKLDGLLTDNKAIAAELADHETRLRRLEGARWPLPTVGILAGAAGAATGLFALFQH